MKTIAHLEEQIEELPEGYVFTHNDFKEFTENENSVEHFLNTLAKRGTITKLAKDKFYKPEILAEGEQLLKPYEVVKDLLYDGEQQVGYLTGASVFANFDFDAVKATQLEVGLAEKRNPIKRGAFKICFVKQNNPIIAAHIPYFQILDVLRAVHSTNSATPEELCYHMTKRLTALSSPEHKTIAKLALNYNARTRALTGAMLQKIGYLKEEILMLLKDSIAAYNSFTFHIPSKNLPHAKAWKILCD